MDEEGFSSTLSWKWPGATLSYSVLPLFYFHGLVWGRNLRPYWTTIAHFRYFIKNMKHPIIIVHLVRLPSCPSWPGPPMASEWKQSQGRTWFESMYFGQGSEQWFVHNWMNKRAQHYSPWHGRLNRVNGQTYSNKIWSKIQVFRMGLKSPPTFEYNWAAQGPKALL